MCNLTVNVRARAMHGVLLAWALCVFVHSGAFTPYTVLTLKPRQPLKRETIVLGSEVKRYRIARLLPNSGYEVKVSYPATVRKTSSRPNFQQDSQDVAQHNVMLLRATYDGPLI
jgi:hypothetical protein